MRTAEEASLPRTPAALRFQALPFVVLLAVLPGCVQQPREAPTCEDTTEFACFRGAFRTLVGDPVPDLELCPRDLPEVPCATTDAEGQWQIPGLPRDSNLAVFAEHPEYTPTLFPQASAMDWYAWFKVAVPPFVLNTHANRLDVELDPERGHLLFDFFRAKDRVPHEGVKVELRRLKRLLPSTPEREVLFPAWGSVFSFSR